VKLSHPLIDHIGGQQLVVGRTNARRNGDEQERGKGTANRRGHG